jgi:hypothetical protein
MRVITSEKEPISDTVQVTSDGAIIVDAEKLLSKPHIKQMMRDIRSKTRVVFRKSPNGSVSSSL